MKTIAIIIAIIIVAVIPLLLLIAGGLRIRPATEEEEAADLLGDAYQVAFHLQRHLAASDDERYRRASVKLNKVIDTLLEVERMIQEENKQ